jgi:hypothetical protein
MSRALLQIVLPLLLPTLLYLVWAVLIHKNGGNDEEELRWLRRGPWLWLILGGVVLMAIALSVTAWISGVDLTGTYLPPRIENGRVVPGRFE